MFQRSKKKLFLFLSGRVNENLTKCGQESHDTPKTVSVPIAPLAFFAPGNRLLFCERHLIYFGMFYLYYITVDLQFFQLSANFLEGFFVPTFVTKVTAKFCSSWVFSDNFNF